MYIYLAFAYPMSEDVRGGIRDVRVVTDRYEPSCKC